MKRATQNKTCFSFSRGTPNLFAFSPLSLQLLCRSEKREEAQEPLCDNTAQSLSKHEEQISKFMGEIVSIKLFPVRVLLVAFRDGEESSSSLDWASPSFSETIVANFIHM